MNPGEPYEVRLTGEALRSLAKVPPRIAEPLVTFVFRALAENPKRRGKPLIGEFDGLWSARRGDYRVIYSVDDEANRVIVHRVASRADAYRPR